MNNLELIIGSEGNISCKNANKIFIASSNIKNIKNESW